MRCLAARTGTGRWVLLGSAGAGLHPDPSYIRSWGVSQTSLETTPTVFSTSRREIAETQVYSSCQSRRWLRLLPFHRQPKHSRNHRRLNFHAITAYSQLRPWNSARSAWHLGWDAASVSSHRAGYCVDLCQKSAALSRTRQPERQVYLDDFWIDRTEVTNRMFAALSSNGLCHGCRTTWNWLGVPEYGVTGGSRFPGRLAAPLGRTAASLGWRNIRWCR